MEVKTLICFFIAITFIWFSIRSQRRISMLRRENAELVKMKFEVFQKGFQFGFEKARDKAAKKCTDFGVSADFFRSIAEMGEEEMKRK